MYLDIWPNLNTPHAMDLMEGNNFELCAKCRNGKELHQTKKWFGCYFCARWYVGECAYGYKPGKGLKIVKCEVCLETQKCLEGMLVKR